MEQLLIGEIANRVGLRTSAIRFYERAGLLAVPRRINGRRRYEPAVIHEIRIIQLAQQAGFTIAEIRVLLRDFPADAPPAERWRKLTTQKLAEVDNLLDQLQKRKTLLEQTLLCTCATLSDCPAGLDSPPGEA